MNDDFHICRNINTINTEHVRKKELKKKQKKTLYTNDMYTINKVIVFYSIFFGRVYEKWVMEWEWKRWKMTVGFFLTVRYIMNNI